ncbi:hypothetical protein Dsin_010878 [Dipteronia sinensis]|uniref:Uncharacterized protein n=1 Tax=Dipteronia sinensis TaxID=43782 RepID=A0AAE0ECZ9_9ROSI|nr:hypothetical protein Dsin_010878 [Dipteronia sinensis]
MVALEPVLEREREEREAREEEENERREKEDLERGEVGVEEKVVESNKNVEDDDDVHHPQQQKMDREFQEPMMHRLNPTNPLRIVINGGTRVAAPRMATPSPSQASQPRSTPAPTPTPQQSLTTLNSRRYTNKISLFIFALHMVLAVGLVCFLVFKGVQGLIVASDSVKRKREKGVEVFAAPG